ncbi:MAG: FAD-dependent oxidoreductase [Clostridiales bacterium]|nr:FAD-dependent oxidoreductase [Clostridiales bacterium]
MHYDAVVIGAGLAGLTAASLLAKRGLHVAVIEKAQTPGGSCGIFKRHGAIFDQGSAMLFGFGEHGFNAHRFVFNCLEEPIDVIRHELLYTVNFKGHRIRFWPDIQKFADELSQVFPAEKENIHRFYREMETIYRHVMVEHPNYNTPDETDPAGALKSLARHPLSYLRFLSFLNLSAGKLLKHYFSDPEIFKFFTKLTSTYCYATVDEAPAILAAVMFVDNHVGGSYYPAGSTVYLPGKLEKVIEEQGGDVLYGREATRIFFEDGKPAGVVTDKGERIHAEEIIYSGTVWNLYGKLIAPEHVKPERIQWVSSQQPTYPSVMLYALVDRAVIPEDTQPVEMLVGNPDHIDESEVTAYIPSIDDLTLCGEDEHVVTAIGPTFEQWTNLDDAAYREKKQKEQQRLIEVLERRFPGFGRHVRFAQMATPRTIERYCLKNGGAVAGPKQMLGQHMFKRLHTRTQWSTLFCCGESTVMGTGTPTVTTSAISAANAVLKKRGLSPFVYRPDMKNHVRLLTPPVMEADIYADAAQETRQMMRLASACQYCEHPRCCDGTELDIPGVMRRAAVGNIMGARKALAGAPGAELLQACEDRCVEKRRIGRPVQILQIVRSLTEVEG